MTYSSSMALNRQRYMVRGTNVVSFRRDAEARRLGPITNTVILIILACLLGLLYLTQVTKTNAFGYAINNLQNQQQTLKVQHDDLAVSSARLQSMDRVQTSSVAQNMTQTAPTATIQ